MKSFKEIKKKHDTGYIKRHNKICAKSIPYIKQKKSVKLKFKKSKLEMIFMYYYMLYTFPWNIYFTIEKISM